MILFSLLGIFLISHVSALRATQRRHRALNLQPVSIPKGAKTVVQVYGANSAPSSNEDANNGEKLGEVLSTQVADAASDSRKANSMNQLIMEEDESAAQNNANALAAEIEKKGLLEETDAEALLGSEEEEKKEHREKMDAIMDMEEANRRNFGHKVNELHDEAHRAEIQLKHDIGELHGDEDKLQNELNHNAARIAREERKINDELKEIKKLGKAKHSHHEVEQHEKETQKQTAKEKDTSEDAKIVACVPESATKSVAPCTRVIPGSEVSMMDQK